MTDDHALRILVGGLWVCAATVADRKGINTSDSHWIVTGGIMFWTFVVAAWIDHLVVFFVA